MAIATAVPQSSIFTPLNPQPPVRYTTIMAHQIILSQQHRDDLVAHARAEHPRECCGLLVGWRGEDALHISKIIQATNITDDDPTRAYQIDWPTLFQTIRNLRNISQELVGFYHSHPTGSSTPSQRDRREAWIDHSYLIIGHAQDPTATVTAWALRSTTADFDPQQVIVQR